MSQAVSRALAIVDLCEAAPRTLGEIAAALGVHPTTAMRLAHSLSKAGYLRLDGGRYQLGPRVVSLGAAFLSRLDLRAVAAPVLTELAAATGETVHLAQRVGDTVVYVDKVESIHPLRMYSQVGRSAPLHCTGVGKVILAHAPDLLELVSRDGLELRQFTAKTITTVDGLLAECSRIREAGYSEDDEEHEITINCLAAPVFDSDNRVIGGVSVAAPVHRLPLVRLREFAPTLREGARSLSRALGSSLPG